MDLPNLVWSELFADEELDSEFDRAGRDTPPWFGFPPRVLAIVPRRPFQPAFALWREGAVVEAGVFGVDRRRIAGRVRPWLLLAEAFADMCRDRNLFGAHFIVSADADDALGAATSALLIREADWCGMFVGEPHPAARGAALAAAGSLARQYAAALIAGAAAAPTRVARVPTALRPPAGVLKLRLGTNPDTPAPAVR